MINDEQQDNIVRHMQKIAPGVPFILLTFATEGDEFNVAANIPPQSITPILERSVEAMKNNERDDREPIDGQVVKS